MKLLIAVGFFFAPFFVPAQSSAQNCLPQEQANFMFANYKISRWVSAKNDYAPVQKITDLCDSKALPVRLAKSLHFMNQLNANQDSKSSSIVTREGAGNYFKKRIRQIVIEEKNSGDCPGGVVAYVFRFEKDTMHVCTEGIETFESELKVSSILIHEARHIDGYSHVHCAHGLYRKSDSERASNGSCDDSYETQGSYGVAAGFFAEILRTSRNPVLKQEARAYYVVDMVERFNKLPLDLKSGLAAQASSGEVSFYDGTKKLPLFVGAAKAVMTMRADIPAFFYPAGQVKSYSYSKNLVDTGGGYALDYATKYTPAERESLKDVYYGSLHDYSCLLFDRKLRCGDNYASDPDVDVTLSIRPLQFLFSEKSSLVNNEVLYIVADDGYLYPLPAKWNDFKTWAKRGNLKPSSKPYNLRSLVKLSGSNEFGVTLDGRFMQFSPDTKTWTPIKEYQAQELQKVTAPFFWSKKLEEI